MENEENFSGVLSDLIFVIKFIFDKKYLKFKIKQALINKRITKLWCLTINDK